MKITLKHANAYKTLLFVESNDGTILIVYQNGKTLADLSMQTTDIHGECFIRFEPRPEHRCDKNIVYVSGD